MIVVPMPKDVIQTNDNKTYRVVAYTNFKDGGPAVYGKQKGSTDVVAIYFFDIVSINGTKVEYSKPNKIFEALGRVERRYQLPQPGDKVVVLSGKSTNTDEKETAKVAGLKLKAKNLGISKGMFVRDEDGSYYRLKNVFDIIRDGSHESFDRDGFLGYYKDYVGV